MGMRRILLTALACVSLAACQGEEQETSAGYGLAGFDPHASETQKAACEARGGTFKTGGLGGIMTCFETPKDAGKRCSKSSDCSTGMCLARSQSCTPIMPLFGCNDVLDAEGRKVSLCVD